MNQEPLPCPFCGCPSFIRGGGTSRSGKVPYSVRCVNVLCAVQISDWDSRDSSLKRWNTRSATVKQSLTVEHADIRSTSEHSVVATNIAEKSDIIGWLRRRENWKAVCITGQMVREIANMCQSYVNAAPENDQSGVDQITRLTAELAECRDRIGALETIIAACRDAVPLPPSGSEQEKLWPDAMSDASCVPAYIAAGFLVVRSTVLAEAASVVADHNREGRQWVPGSLWGTITQECAARINSLSETHTFRLQYIEGVGTVAVMEPK